MVTGRKLLLADDSVTIQKVVGLTFTDEGMEVITVSDGQQALEKLEEVAPDIVLADVFMPRLSGYELCEYIKRNERFRHIPVMLLVGSFEPFDEAEARRVGADDYLTKPFQSIRTLISKVGSLLTGGGGGEASEAATRQLAPPPEAEKENRPDTGFLDRSTADTAPLPAAQAEAGRVAAAGGGSREVPFSDLSMDDEMIEATTPAGDPAGAEQAVYARRTEQYSLEDLREAGIPQAILGGGDAVESDVGESGAVESDATENEVVESGAAESAQAPPLQEAAADHLAPAQAGESSTDAGQSQAAARPRVLNAYDDSLLDLDEVGPPAAMAEADDFILDLRDEAPWQPQGAEAAAAAATAAPMLTETTPPAQDYSWQAGAGTAAAEEEASYSPAHEEEAASVEERPDEDEFAHAESEAGPAAEATPDAQAPAQQTPSYEFSIAPTERLPEDFQIGGATPESAYAAEDAQGSPRSQEGLITLEQLSPEVIDAIARRAAEHLSERVVEQVAWEVVPQLAELMIKRRLEEEKSQ